jgi:hypothetical protein
MSKDPKSDGDQDVSRRRLLKKAALAVGAATSVVAARTALARSSDVVMDSAGRVLIHGAALPAQRPEGSFEAARVGMGTNDQCINADKCTGGNNKGCSNARACVAPRAMQPTGTKANAPLGGSSLTAPKVNAPVGGSSLTAPKVNAPVGGSRK